MEIHFVANEAHGIVLCIVVLSILLSGVLLGKYDEEPITVPGGLLLGLSVIGIFVFTFMLIFSKLFS